MAPNIPNELLIKRILKQSARNVLKEGWEQSPDPNNPFQHGFGPIEAIQWTATRLIQTNGRPDEELTKEEKTKRHRLKNQKEQACKIAIAALAINLELDWHEKVNPYNPYTAESVIKRWNYHKGESKENVAEQLERAGNREDFNTIAHCIRITPYTLNAALAEAYSILSRGDHFLESPILTTALNKGIENVPVYDLTDKHGKEIGILRHAAHTMVAREKQEDEMKRPEGISIWLSDMAARPWILSEMEAAQETKLVDAKHYLKKAQSDDMLNMFLNEAKKQMFKKEG